MAKSSRSKWKKLHRRQRAQSEAQNTAKRIKNLHHKLELTVKGGISAVPPEEPETRFHFLNPELDPRVPNTRKDLNNSGRLDLGSGGYDYNRPLALRTPTTNYYGKSDPSAPHPMTVQYETIDADAPIAGHGLTKRDMERLEERGIREAAAKPLLTADANEEGLDAKEDGMEEYVFGLDDTAARKSSAKKTAKGLGRAVEQNPNTASAAKDDTEVEEEEAGSRTRIKSMEGARKKAVAGGTQKMKKVGHPSAKVTRMVSSGSKVATKRSLKRA